MRLFHLPFYDSGSTGPWESAIDDGFPEYVYAIYRYMTAGLLFSGALAMLCARSQLYAALAAEPFVAFPMLLLPLVYVVEVSRRIEQLSPRQAKGYFWLFALLIGFSFAGMSLSIWGQGIALAFFEMAAAFFVVSMIGFFSKRSMTPIGTFIMLALVGIGLALLVNGRVASPDHQLLITIMGIALFSALTAWDTPVIKARFYRIRSDDDIRNPKPSIGALNLYLDFINRFLSLLRINAQQPPREG